MRKIRAALIRLAGMFGGSRATRDFDTEIHSHLQMLIDDNVRAGMTPEEARRHALARFGGMDAVRETYRDQRGVPLLDTTLQDARYALRMLRRSPGATLLGILVMALGIGANTAVFSVVHAVLLNPLPYANPDRIVTFSYLSSLSSTPGGEGVSERSRQVSVPDFVDWKAQASSFEAMAFYSTGRAPVMSGPAAEYAVVTRASAEFFRVFAVDPAIGRPFSRDELREGGTGAALVSDRYARQQFGSAANARGRSIRMFNRVVPIVGVLPAGFAFPVETEIWFPMEAQLNVARQNRRGNNFRALARLHAGASLAQAQTEVSAIAARLEAQYPETNTNVRVILVPLQQEIVGDVQAMLYLLLGAVTLVLLIGCATMATLLLAKATARVPEMAVRAAVGATRARIVKQLLVEALVQAFAAGLAGVIIAFWATRALVALAPPGVPRLAEVVVSGNVLLFTLALCVLVSILFGLPPALQAARVDVHEPLRRNAARVTTAAGGRTREGLVIAEIAIAVVLLVTGALLVRSLIALQQAPLGFDPRNVLVMQATAPPRAQDWSDSRAYFKGVLDDVRLVPGVVAAGAMMAPPGRTSADSGYWLDRRPPEGARAAARPAVMNVISPGAFAALGAVIRQGRDFTDADTRDAPQVAIINEALARAAFGTRDPLGRAIVAGFDSDEPMTIVGVVSDLRQYGPGREPQPELYMPYQQHFYNGATLFVLARTATEPAALSGAIERKARERSPEVSVRLSTLEGQLAEHVATPKFRAWLLSLFAGIALCLAMSGVYGVMAYVAGQRSKEIGVRMALGANAGSVLWLMLGRGLTLTGIGLAAGVLGALAATRFVRGMLFEVTPYDLVTYAAVIATLGLLALVATYIPARRATRVDALVVLRQE